MTTDPGLVRRAQYSTCHATVAAPACVPRLPPRVVSSASKTSGTEVPRTGASMAKASEMADSDSGVQTAETLVEAH